MRNPQTELYPGVVRADVEGWIDQANQDSFPASDPPAIGGITRLIDSVELTIGSVIRPRHLPTFEPTNVNESLLDNSRRAAELPIEERATDNCGT
ncbi:hypothetical protein [Caballeronia sp. LZ043]|uniref:hypothetical protein n=1 Tax=Caballeronia sp. LZ043 TaxID=3038569 RepID=UPI0028642A36|nr:hypothetical protein [Caballeronia sp. LZ043]MDR5826110.1 hypothetical protein [Caballeronia sp. LZ043]